jgi:type I restriction enzyme S subunit
MSDWPLVELSKLVEDLTVGFVGSMTQEYIDTGVPFFRSKNIKPYDLDWDDIKYVSQEFHEKLKKSALKPGDVVIVRTGKPGTACVIPDSVEEANCSDVVIARVDDRKLSAHYLSYFMNSVAAHQVSSHLVGAVQQHFNVGSAKKIKIPLPPREEQDDIVAVLKALDDKLKLNRQINQTLEQIAQAIFKSWFVDFEPVKAKIEAKQNGQDPERAAMRAISGKNDEELDALSPEQHQQLTTTAALFPDELEESELGVMPKGWRVKSLDEIATYLNGLALQKFPPKEDEQGLPVIKIAEMRSGFSDKSGKATEDLDSNYIIQDGDILFSWSGSLLVKQWYLGRGALNQHLFKVTSDVYPKWFYYFSTLSHLPWFQSIAASKATTMGHIQRKHLSDAKIAIGTSELLDAGDKIMGPLLDKSLEVMLESKTLQELRDSLLPKLLSGELEVQTS